MVLGRQDTRLDDGQWHHLVTVSYDRTLQDGRPDMAIFVDGRRETLSPHGEGKRRNLFHEVNTITDAPDSVPLLVGKSLLNQNKQSFRGEIDDLYIFDGALTEESIRQLAAGKLPKENQ